MWVFSNKTNLKCFWYLRHVSSFDPYDHLFKISHWKQCIVGGTWYLLLSVISTFQNWVNTKFCIGFAMICASYQHTTEYTKFAIETYAWVMVSDLQVHYVISNRNMTHLCQNIFNDKWKSNIIWQLCTIHTSLLQIAVSTCIHDMRSPWGTSQFEEYACVYKTTDSYSWPRWKRLQIAASTCIYDMRSPWGTSQVEEYACVYNSTDSNSWPRRKRLQIAAHLHVFMICGPHEVPHKLRNSPVYTILLTAIAKWLRYLVVKHFTYPLIIYMQ